MVGDFYVRQLRKEGAKYGLSLWNKTVKTYHNVSQFWTYDEKKFLAQPVYSRDYPPLKSMMQSSAGAASAVPAARGITNERGKPMP